MPKVTARRGVEIADLFRIRLVNDPEVSPDGTRVTFTVTELDEQDNRYRAAIWRVDLDDGHPAGEPRRLTSGRHRDGTPRWSPDGATIALPPTANLMTWRRGRSGSSRPTAASRGG